MFSSTSKIVGTAAVVGAILVPSALAAQSPALHDAWYQQVSQSHTSAQVSLLLHDSWYLSRPAVRSASKNPYGTLGPSRARIKRINNDNAK
jgi:hypothetical protein